MTEMMNDSLKRIYWSVLENYRKDRGSVYCRIIPKEITFICQGDIGGSPVLSLKEIMLDFVEYFGGNIKDERFRDYSGKQL